MLFKSLTKAFTCSFSKTSTSAATKNNLTRTYTGKVSQIISDVVDIEFQGSLPPLLNALEVQGLNHRLVLEVSQHLDNSKVRAIALDTTDGLTRGQEVFDPGYPIMIPVGTEVLGRTINALGEPIDERGPIASKNFWSIYQEAPSMEDRVYGSDIMTTGIKAIDLLCPITRGGKTGVLGGDGVGKTSLFYEFFNNIGKAHGGVFIFANVGERVNEASEWYNELVRDRILDYSNAKCTYIHGNMHEKPATQSRAALTGLTIAEYFRDESGRDVLLFIDNMFRFAQACSEVSALLSRIPSSVDYQPPKGTDLDTFQERLNSTKKGSITSIQGIQLPTDDLADPTAATILPHLDTAIVLSRSLAQNGLFPAIDPLLSTSRMLDPTFVGEKHYNTARGVQKLLQDYRSLQGAMTRLGIDGLSEEDKRIVSRARKVQKFLSQPLYFAWRYTARHGRFAILPDTINGVNTILNGEADELPETVFYMIGDIDEAFEEAKRTTTRSVAK